MMTYFDILRPYKMFGIQCELSFACQSLFDAIVWEFNRKFFPQELRIHGSVLSLLSGISYNNIWAVRKSLCDYRFYDEPIVSCSDIGTNKVTCYSINLPLFKFLNQIMREHEKQDSANDQRHEVAQHAEEQFRNRYEIFRNRYEMFRDKYEIASSGSLIPLGSSTANIGKKSNANNSSRDDRVIKRNLLLSTIKEKYNPINFPPSADIERFISMYSSDQIMGAIARMPIQLEGGFNPYSFLNKVELWIKNPAWGAKRQENDEEVKENKLQSSNPHILGLQGADWLYGGKDEEDKQ